MKILVVARYKERGFVPFVTEQVQALETAGVECRLFPVKNNGPMGYLRHLSALKDAIRDFKPDVIHAHYGMCGLLANLQRTVPVVTTYHGSDINKRWVLQLSRIAMRLSAYNIFVSRENIESARPKRNYVLIPCGITLDDFPIVEKTDARNRMCLEQDQTYVLFAGAFDNPVKNAGLAKEAVALLPQARLLELKGYSRMQVAMLMQAVDVLVMTSYTEGSPQVIKEAMACGCPIVSVDVGDVRERVNGVEGCFVSQTREPQEIAGLIGKALALSGRTRGRESIVAAGLDNNSVAGELKKIYKISQNR